MTKLQEKQNIPSGWQENKLIDCFRVPSKLVCIKISEYETNREAIDKKVEGYLSELIY